MNMQQITAAYTLWENDRRTNPDVFSTDAECLAMDVQPLVEQLAKTFAHYLQQAGGATELIGEVKQWFNAAVPNPTDKNRAVQIGCHFEEVSEMAGSVCAPGVEDKLKEYATFFKCRPGVPSESIDRKRLLDDLADQIVTAVGVAHMFNLDIIGALAEVNRSNWSKFVGGKPVFDENGKIKKGPDYTPPNLDPFVGATGA